MTITFSCEERKYGLPFWLAHEGAGTPCMPSVTRSSKSACSSALSMSSISRTFTPRASASLTSCFTCGAVKS